MKLTIGEAVEVDTVLIQLSASDPDAGANGRIVYQVTSGNEMGLFYLDPNTGVLKVAKALDYENPRGRLVVKVRPKKPIRILCRFVSEERGTQSS